MPVYSLFVGFAASWCIALAELGPHSQRRIDQVEALAVFGQNWAEVA